MRKILPCTLVDLDSITDVSLRGIKFRQEVIYKLDLKKPNCAGKMMHEGSVELETVLSLRSPTADMENDDLFGKPMSTKSRDACSDWLEKNFYSSLLETQNQRNQAALRLQKVYKSFRTRRQLADCAVLAEQRWLVSTHEIYLGKHSWNLHETLFILFDTSSIS